jgi:hypothetical protein
MTKPVAVFRAGVKGDSRGTVSFDETSHLMLFPSFSRYITSWAISATSQPLPKKFNKKNLGIFF